MAKTTERTEPLNANVFINCPFDADYKPCFEAILFTVAMSGYQARTALEEDDSGDVRLAKLLELIKSSDRAIHDLSRTASGVDGLPRFNMPFELGLAMGAKHYGTGRQRRKRALILVTQPFAMQRFLSDLSGNDAKAHRDDPRTIVRLARDHLHTDPGGERLPGAAFINELLKEFQEDLPNLAASARLTADEVDPYQGYRNYMDSLRAFRETFNDLEA